VSDVGDITQIIVRYLSDTGIKVNTFGFICVTNVANGLSNLESAFRTAMIKNTSGGLLYAVSSFYSVDSLLVEDVKPGTAASYESSFTAVSGADTGDPLPPQCASVFSLRTGLKGRSYRGRFFLPATSETNQANGAVIGAYTTKLNTISAQLLAVFGPAGTNGDWRLGVISRYLNKVQRTTPVCTQVTSISIDPVLHTQRRRVYGVGM